MNPNNVLKPTKLIIPGGNAVKTQMPSEPEVMSTNAEQACDHDYVMEASLVKQAKRKDTGSAPPTPSKPPSGKKSKSETEVSNLTILEAIQGMEKNRLNKLAAC